MFISRNLTYIFLGRVFFCLFLEHDPKPFPFGCACPTEGYFLMGPRQAALGSGRGRAGRGRECHLRPRTTLAPSRRPRRAHLHFFHKPPATAAVAVSGRAGLRKAWEGGWQLAWQPGKQEPRRRSPPCFVSSGQDRRRNWRHPPICTTSYFYVFRNLKFYTNSI